MLHSCKLIGRKIVAHETLSVRVERPQGFSFEAGQYADVTVMNAADRDALGPMRSLSITSAPGEPHLEFLMRQRDSAFKRNLATLPLGTELLVEGPFDDLRLGTAGDREKVFIAGGVGVAPFLSVVRHAAAAESELNATLFWSNRRPEDAPYLDQLRHLASEIRGFRLIPIMTRVPQGIAPPAGLSWDGETDRLSIDLLSRYLDSLVGPAYFMAGGSFLISQLRLALTGAGVLDTDIGLEMYAGY